MIAKVKKASELIEMTGQVVGRLFTDIQRECHDGGEGAKAVIQAYDEGQDDKGYLVLYQPPGPNGSESLNSEHAAHIVAAAAEHAEAIGCNFNDKLPKWDQGYTIKAIIEACCLTMRGNIGTGMNSLFNNRNRTQKSQDIPILRTSAL